MSLSARFEPSAAEGKWYQYWMDKGYFHSTPDEREAYSIVIPPPNVTGVLHMGHMLNNTIQDVLIRKARLDGKNACWVPGTDHASIATEAKVVKMLREKGIKKSDLTREQFLEHAHAWKDQYGGIILKQLQKLGASCDWERTAFTMDESRSEHVIKAFVDLYNKDKLYRGLRMVNWDPQAQTVLSNEEVLYEDEMTQLYHVRYKIEGTEEYVTIATTRPETIMGDSAIAVHPDDPRYTHLKGKRAIVPMIGRSVPIIFDDYVDIEFGTGALKVTPAHDINDYELGKKHDLETIDVLNDDGTLSEAAQIFIGRDREEVRVDIKIKLKEENALVEIENYNHSVGRSERTQAIVEPKLSLQWYVDMKSLAKPALDAVMTDEVEFFPKNQKNLYKHWMEGIRDWCISRQLWWGHRIPAYYYKDEIFVAATDEEALFQAKVKFGEDVIMSDLRQDEDALDTWFSSWLWPIAVFDGWNNKEELEYYYPTSVLVTGWDIIFLWVARMVMAGYEWEGKRPFDHVYFTGMVRDKQRRKMSKSLGNSPDALGLIEKFGADGVRVGMLMSSPAGGDLLFDEKLCDQGSKFCNKIWNALKLIKGFDTEKRLASATDQLANDWITARLHQVIDQQESNFKEYRLSEALMGLYTFVWSDFCSWYLEMIKPEYGGTISTETQDMAIDLLEQISTILHPFMPFITEEMWHSIRERADGDDCIISTYPTKASYDKSLIKDIDQLKDIVSNTRDIRNKNGIKMTDSIPLYAVKSEKMDRLLRINGLKDLAAKMGHLEAIHLSDDNKVSGVGFISGTESFVFGVSLEIDVEAEVLEIESEIKRLTSFIGGIEKKLSNERFVSGAPETVVNSEKKKLEDGKEKIANLQSNVERLRGL
ncbi:MAG: valine--tRNA ligase [Saprospiraceae bacterium]|mgnify:FL=1|jgi:valyl-tRNA synthetase|tara:strand:- start:3078 stop:5708 length:2631 start_codon:yes stop_codon:yes gene_type:complete